jgi:hypothetical protein
VWPGDLQKAWQANLFEPHHVPEGPETFDFGSLKNSDLAMKDFLRDNQCPIPGRKLLQEIPPTQLDLYFTLMRRARKTPQRGGRPDSSQRTVLRENSPSWTPSSGFTWEKSGCGKVFWEKCP